MIQPISDLKHRLKALANGIALAYDVGKRTKTLPADAFVYHFSQEQNRASILKNGLLVRDDVGKEQGYVPEVNGVYLGTLRQVLLLRDGWKDREGGIGGDIYEVTVKKGTSVILDEEMPNDCFIVPQNIEPKQIKLLTPEEIEQRRAGRDAGLNMEVDLFGIN